MDSIESLREELAKTAHIADPLERRLYALAVIGRALPAEDRPILVGGNALEFYTFGGYSTGDIDVIHHDRAMLDRALMSLGFKRTGRHWTREDVGIAIECPDEYLAGSLDRVNVVTIEGVGEVRIIGLEDLIIDRLNACVHWDSEEDCFWAARLVSEYRERLDLGYLKNRADGQVLDFLLKMLSEEPNG